MNDALVFSALARQGRTPPIEDRHIVEKVSKESAIKELNDKEKLLNAEEREAREEQNRKKKKKAKSQSKSPVLMDNAEPEKLFDKTGHLPTEHDPEHTIKHVDDYA